MGTRIHQPSPAQRIQYSAVVYMKRGCAPEHEEIEKERMETLALSPLNIFPLLSVYLCLTFSNINKQSVFLSD